MPLFLFHPAEPMVYGYIQAGSPSPQWGICSRCLARALHVPYKGTVGDLSPFPSLFRQQMLMEAALAKRVKAAGKGGDDQQSTSQCLLMNPASIVVARRIPKGGLLLFTHYTTFVYCSGVGNIHAHVYDLHAGGLGRHLHYHRAGASTIR